MLVKHKLLNFGNNIIYQDDKYFNFSLDSVLLSNFVTLNLNINNILDLCTGNAPIPMLLSFKTKAKIYGIELQQEIFDLGLKSIKENKMDKRIELINDNVKNIGNHFGIEYFDVITCNPPYFKLNDSKVINNNDVKSIARHEIEIKLDEIIELSAKYLKSDGRLCLVHRPERLIEIITLMKKNGLEPKKIRFAHPKKNKEANMVLIEGLKNGNIGLKVMSPLVVHNDNGEYCEEIKKCLRSKYMWQSSYEKENNLYLVSTPIGNLDDITLRSINILKEVEVVFSEDTRVTKILLNHLNINKRVIALHEHNEDTAKEKVLEYLKNNYSVALVTDRGTPIISDPGYKTVKYIIKNNYNVVALPGPCAFVPALITSGIDPSHFLFYGFLNSKASKRKKELENLKDNKNTIIFYEAPHRIVGTLNDVLNILGDRNISISRELTKKYESVYRGTITEFLKLENIIKGEFVLVVEGDSLLQEGCVDFENLILKIDNYIKMGISKQEAIKKVAKSNNMSKSILYNEYHREEK